MANVKQDPTTGEFVLDETGELSVQPPKKAKKQLRKRGVKPFDFVIDWDDIKVKCIVPKDYDDIQELQRQLISKAQELQQVAQQPSEVNPALQGDLLAVLDQGSEIAKMTLNYSYQVVAKCVAGWDNGPWEFNRDTWQQEVFDLEPEDVQALATEISQRVILSRAEADFLAHRCFR
jgi:hypothetical protein